MQKFTVKVNGKNGKCYKSVASYKEVASAMCGDYNGNKEGSICEMPFSVVKNAYNYGTSKLGCPRNLQFEAIFFTFGATSTTQWTNGVRVVPDKDF